MNTLLFAIAGVVVAITAGLVAQGYSSISGIVYVFLAMVDMGLFSYFCVINKNVQLRPFGIYVIAHLALSLVFIAAR